MDRIVRADRHQFARPIPIMSNLCPNNAMGLIAYGCEPIRVESIISVAICTLFHVFDFKVYVFDQFIEIFDVFLVLWNEYESKLGQIQPKLSFKVCRNGTYRIT